MKVLFYSFVPFSFAHGGQQIQIQQSALALRELGVDVEFIRWYDATQNGDILHFFGRIPRNLLSFAHEKGLKVVVADLFGGQSARPPWRLAAQKRIVKAVQKIPRLAAPLISTDVYRRADACVTVSQREASILHQLYEVPDAKTHVVPNAVEQVFLASQSAQRGKWLLCTATITEVKRVVELAQAAVVAQTPVWFAGKPYSEEDPYARMFLTLAKANPEFIRYQGSIDNREELARAYRSARAFVLLSAYESLSLSALEAAACECPLLLSDLPWARTEFGSAASYCPAGASGRETARVLRNFYERAPELPLPPKPPSWAEAARKLKVVYEKCLKHKDVY